MAQCLTPCTMCTPGQQCVFCRDDESMAALESLESEIWGIMPHDDVLGSDICCSDVSGKDVGGSDVREILDPYFESDTFLAPKAEMSIAMSPLDPPDPPKPPEPPKPLSTTAPTNVASNFAPFQLWLDASKAQNNLYHPGAKLVIEDSKLARYTRIDHFSNWTHCKNPTTTYAYGTDIIGHCIGILTITHIESKKFPNSTLLSHKLAPPRVMKHWMVILPDSAEIAQQVAAANTTYELNKANARVWFEHFFTPGLDFENQTYVGLMTLTHSPMRGFQLLQEDLERGACVAEHHLYKERLCKLIKKTRDMEDSVDISDVLP